MSNDAPAVPTINISTKIQKQHKSF